MSKQLAGPLMHRPLSRLWRLLPLKVYVVYGDIRGSQPLTDYLRIAHRYPTVRLRRMDLVSGRTFQNYKQPTKKE